MLRKTLPFQSILGSMVPGCCTARGISIVDGNLKVKCCMSVSHGKFTGLYLLTMRTTARG